MSVGESLELYETIKLNGKGLVNFNMLLAMFDVGFFGKFLC